jgi:sirohydrochlorin cobaltochelatase
MAIPRLPVLVAALSACVAPSTSTAPSPPDSDGGPPSSTVGVLVMAHGGGAEWNRTVSAAVAPLSERMPITLAFGMADPATLTASLDSLRDRGVEQVAVVRMFLSGRSFLTETRYLLGLDGDVHEGEHDSPAAHAGGMASMHGPLHPIEHGLTVATHQEGMLLSEEAGRILAGRAEGLSQSRGDESVLLVAHGMGDDAENDAVLASLDRVARGIRAAGFQEVETATLREDWPEKRAEAERRLRTFVERETAAGRRVLVVPARLSGFGPYAEVLDGLEYVPGEGLLPHDEISVWIERTAARIACAQGWESGLGTC